MPHQRFQRFDFLYSFYYDLLYFRGMRVQCVVLRFCLITDWCCPWMMCRRYTCGELRMDKQSGCMKDLLGSTPWPVTVSSVCLGREITGFALCSRLIRLDKPNLKFGLRNKTQIHV